MTITIGPGGSGQATIVTGGGVPVIASAGGLISSALAVLEATAGLPGLR